MKSVESLIGARIAILANDFVDATSTGRVLVIEAKSNSILLGLDVPVSANGLRYSRAIGSPRLARDGVDTLLSTGLLGCGITWIPDECYSASNPFNLSWWRGGAAAIADIVLQR